VQSVGRHWLKKALATAIGGALLAPGALLGAAEEPPPAPPAVAPAAPEPAAPQTPDSAPVPPAPAEPEAAPEQAVARSSQRPPEPETAKPEKAEPVIRAAASGAVIIENFLYAPATIEIAAGDTVTWTNRDEEPHTATGNGGSFNTGNLGRGESGSHTFSSAGRFPYICALHPSMRGTVVVAGAAAESPSDEAATGQDPGAPGAADASGNDAPTLPATGVGVVIVALLGAALAAAGSALRRRL
jgi:plastocyanin